MVGLKLLLGLALVSAVAAEFGSLPSIREMLDDWDAKQAAKAAGVRWAPLPRAIEMPMPTETETETAPDRRDRRIVNRVGAVGAVGALEGVFVTPCNVTQSWFGGGSSSEVAQAKTTQYNVSSDPRANANGTYEVDYTEYVGGTCDPAGGGFDTEVFAKYNIQGTVSHHGTVPSASRICPEGVTCYRAEWTTASSTWMFPEDPVTEPDVSRLLNILNAQCPCKGVWTAGRAGARTITNRQCHKDHVDLNSMFILCGIIGGLPTYANYEYVDTGKTGVVQYRSSALSFVQAEGWSTPPSSRPRTRLPRSGVHYPSDCNFIKYAPAFCGVKEGVESDIANYCDGCTQLECTGCAYRFIEKSRKRPADPGTGQPMSPENFWTECCPCSWQTGDQYGHPWMKFDC